jgi:hypothetical protein
MGDRGASQIGSSGGSPRQVRRRVLALLTANVAMAFALGGWYQAEVRVLPINTARALEIHMLQLEARIQAGPAGKSNGLRVQPTTTRAATDTAEKMRTLEMQMGATAIIAYAWKFMMYLAAAALEVLAILSVLKEHRLWPQVVASCVILASTALTILSMSLLMNPKYGGMEPLLFRSYIYAGLIQGSYGVLLLAATVWPSAVRQPA